MGSSKKKSRGNSGGPNEASNSEEEQLPIPWYIIVKETTKIAKI